MNSFVGVDTGNLTGDAYSADTLFEGNNLACFFLQTTQAGLVDAATPLLEPLGQTLDFLEKSLGPSMSSLGCPQLASLNNEVSFYHEFEVSPSANLLQLFTPYPGASYKAQGQ